MGVMRCSRFGCDNILCGRYSRKYGYICDDCFAELIIKGVSTNISDFLRSEKKLEADSSDFFNEIFSE